MRESFLIPAPDALDLTTVIDIYQTQRAMMPRAVCGAGRQRAALIDILDEFDGLILDGYGVINVGDDLVAGIEDLLLGWAPQSADEWPPFQKMAEFETEMAEVGTDQLLERILKILDERRRELSELDDNAWNAECMTPVGPGTYGRFMNVRVFDFWVHQRDMTIPLGIEIEDSGVHAEIALDEVHGSLGFIAGKKIGLEAVSYTHLTLPTICSV